LSEVFGRINRMKDSDDARNKLAAIKSMSAPQHRGCGTAEDGETRCGNRRWMKQAHVTISAAAMLASMEEFLALCLHLMSMRAHN